MNETICRQQTIREMMVATFGKFSLEVSPKARNSIDGLTRIASPRSEIFIPWIQGDSPDNIVNAAVTISKLGMIAVPHVPARLLTTSDQLRRLLHEAREKADVDRVLILGGDAENPAGPFDASQAVLESPHFISSGIRNVGFAAHPEGHKKISREILSRVLCEKIAYARGLDLEPFLVSQFCFEAKPIMSWLRDLRTSEPTLPVRIGLAGPANIATMLRFAVRCGIGNSTRILKQQGLRFAHMLTDYDALDLLQEICASRLQNSELGNCAIHFFPFGGYARLENWLTREVKN